MWAPGQKIGDYELVATLRSGGMATLFLARRQGAAGFSRPVAIKVVHPELAADPQFRQMFLDEALLAARIQHPNVVHVEELGEHQGSHYLVMEFVHGCSLAQLTRALIARGRRLSPAFATRIAMHVADALHAAHETRDAEGRLLEVVHRDVSPENILLAYAGHVKLIDFGIAKAYGRRHRTQEGLLKGKFRYMAPEQAYGKAVDRRTDIYQLGIVLWEMLTLGKLFDAGSETELLAQVRDPRIPLPSSLVDRIPPALEHAVMIALAKNPSRRHSDAQVFARALAKALPSAHDVDGGALSGLLLGTMQEHRSREQATYPPGVYERLEQQIDTLRMGGATAPQAAEQASALKYTVEHTAPYGSDSPPQTPGAALGQPETRPEVAVSPAVPRRAAGSIRPLPKQPRQRRLVRLASELRTTITAIEQKLFGRRGVWIAGTGAVTVAFALAWATAALRRPTRAARAPAPPSLGVTTTWDSRSRSAAPHAPLAPNPAQLAPGAPDDAPPPEHQAEATVHMSAPFVERRPQAVPADAQAPQSAAKPAAAAAAAERRLPALDLVDGTPLFTEPGF